MILSPDVYILDPIPLGALVRINFLLRRLLPPDACICAPIPPGELVRLKILLRMLLPPLSRSPVSLRLGHARALTPHRGVIHYPRAASLPPGGRLSCAVPLRIVGSGICPISRSVLPRAMLAPDASVGKAEIQPEVELAQ